MTEGVDSSPDFESEGDNNNGTDIVEKVQSAMAENKSRDTTLANLSDSSKAEALQLAEKAQMTAEDPAWIVIHALTELKNVSIYVSDDFVKCFAY